MYVIENWKSENFYLEWSSHPVETADILNNSHTTLTQTIHKGIL
jgi:hypothetical protein